MTTRRRLLALAGAGLALPGALRAQAAHRPPCQRLAVADPPFVETYEVVIALAPPLARNTMGKLITRVATTADEREKSARLTAALDPDKTQLHEHFVQALADRLADADVKTLAVPVEPADSEERLLDQMRDKAPQADGLMLVNVMGRFVALHGLQAYAPGLMVGVVAVSPKPGARPWLDQVFSAGFRGIDPRAEHLAQVALDERFDDIDALLGQAEQARATLVRGTEAVAEVVAQRLMAAA